MAVLSSMLNSLGCYYPEMSSNNREQDLELFDDAATLLISKGAHDRGDDLPHEQGSAVQLLAQGPPLRRQLPAHDVHRTV